MIAQPNLFAGMANHVGVVGRRMKLNLRLVKTVDNVAAYHRYKYYFIDPGGNRLVWATDKKKELKEGDEFDVTFTVKSHSRKGVKKTNITRPVFALPA